MEKGKIYRITHERKGTFDLQVTYVDKTWVHGTIVSGETGTLKRDNARYPGDTIALAKSLIKDTVRLIEVGAR